MIRRLLRSWKEEWLNRNEAKLASEFDKELAELKQNLASAKEEWLEREKEILFEIEKNERELKLKQLDLEVMLKSHDETKARLEKAEAELRNQIKITEAKMQPDQFAATIYALAFSKAWDSLIPLVSDLNEKSMKLIRDQATEDTLKGLRKDGNNKKTY